MTAPRWATALLRRLAPAHEADVLLGDLEEAHRARVARRGAVVATLGTSFEAADVALMLVRRRIRVPRSMMSWLDLKLAFRMLVRYPVLTLVGGASLAFAIALGAAVFAFISLLLWPSLPLPEGDRVVSIRLHDDSTNEFESRVSADLLRWRGHTASLADLGAGRTLQRNLVTPDGTTESVSVAEVTANTFDLVRVEPLKGRVITDQDAHPAAPPVIVIGHALWMSRFGGAPDVVGRTVTLGETPTTVVGVMPQGFTFPSTYQAWMALRLDDAVPAPRRGTALRVWARLAPGVDLPQATAEMAALGAQASADWPATHAHLRPVVQTFADAFLDMAPMDRMLLGSINLAVGLLILLVSGNVALLMFARAATRESEMLVRTALGASRGRLIAQFFSEALVLSGIAACAGLAIARAGINWGIDAFTLAANSGQPLPFWFATTLPPLSIAYACGLALLAAVVTGVLPALNVTRGLHSRLRETSAGGGGLKFGGVWTVVIVAQIAITVTFPVVTLFVKRDGLQIEAMDIGLPANQVLSARLSRDRDVPSVRYRAAVREIREGLASVPGVTGVTTADRLPMMWNGYYEVEVDGGGAAAPEAGPVNRYAVSTAAIDADFFQAFDAAPLAGRLFTRSDFVPAPRVVIVNQSFVTRVLGGRNPIGRRVRYRAFDSSSGPRPEAGPNEPWREIVGLVRDLGMAVEPDPKVAGIYMPLDLASSSTVYLGARVHGDMTAASEALRQLARRTDVTLRVTEVRPLDQVRAFDLREIDFWVRLLAAVSLSAVMLSLTGIYAVMSFTVARRTREIGIRVALGSNRPRVVFAVLRRPFIQVVAGVAVGAILSVLLSGEIIPPTFGMAFAMAGYVVVTFGVCLLACLAPVRRALRVDPIAALRAE